MTVVRLEPDGNGATSNWTKEGAKANWEEVAQAAMQAKTKLKDGTTETEAQEEHKPTEAEGKARGIKSSTSGQQQQFTISAAQVEAKIPAGATIKRIWFVFFAKPETSPSLNTVLEIGNWEQSESWGSTTEIFRILQISKAHIEETTRAKLIEKCQLRIKHNVNANEARFNLYYLEVEYEGGGEAVVGKATGAMLLIGTAVATLRSVVNGTATGALLLTGTSTGTVRSVVAAKATGTLTLAGTSKASLAEVISGKATGAFLLTGTAAGTLRSNVAGKATGHMLLTGSGKAFRPAKETKRSLILIFDE